MARARRTGVLPRSRPHRPARRGTPNVGTGGDTQRRAPTMRCLFPLPDIAIACPARPPSVCERPTGGAGSHAIRRVAVATRTHRRSPVTTVTRLPANTSCPTGIRSPRRHADVTCRLTGKRRQHTDPSDREATPRRSVRPRGGTTPRPAVLSRARTMRARSRRRHCHRPRAAARTQPDPPHQPTAPAPAAPGAAFARAPVSGTSRCASGIVGLPRRTPG